MAAAPPHPKIYHITHVDNIAQIARAGGIWSDAKRIEVGLQSQIVGIPAIKQRRLARRPVKCHPGTMVGEYVPFYLCPRSIMLYILYMGNHPDVTYRGGQGPIVHLEADLRTVVAWADSQGRRWAFTNRNAGAQYAGFFADLDRLDEVNWDAVEATDFRGAVVKEGKQAEFMVYEWFPWDLVERIGVLDLSVVRRVQAAVRDAQYQPPVRVEQAWYY